MPDTNNTPEDNQEDNNSHEEQENMDNHLLPGEEEQQEQPENQEEQPTAKQRSRSTQREFQSRCEQACDLLAEGWPGPSVVKKLTVLYNVTPQQAREYVRQGRSILAESIGMENRAAMFAQVFTGLQQDRMDAREAGNYGAATGASKAMAQLVRSLGDIDPLRDFEREFQMMKRLHTAPIPRVSIKGATDDEDLPF